MAVHNTSADAANTAVRAFLTEIGRFYLNRSFNTALGPAKEDWIRIRDVVFDGKCAYCGKNDSKLQMEHLIMFNRVGFGLHHPGNIVPACPACNSRSKNENIYNSWEQHLSFICERNNEKDKFMDRWNNIKKHIDEGEYKYPDLSAEEKNALRIIASNLYESVKNEFDQAVKLFEELNTAYNKRNA